MAVGDGCNPEGGSLPVGQCPNGSTPHDPVGVLDLSGNVAEWTRDDYESNYESGHEPLLEPVVEGRGGNKVVRGGCYDDDQNSPYLNTTARRAVSAATRTPTVGFRCVQE